MRLDVRADRIIVDAVDQNAAAISLLQAAWSVLLTARGREALHGGVASRDGRALAILGTSGSGKSTALLSLLDSGWELVADDLLTFDDCGNAIPGPPFIRLTPDRAADRIGEWDRTGKLRVWPRQVNTSVPLGAIIVHLEGMTMLERLEGARAVGAILSNFYNDLLTHEGQAERRLELAFALATQVPVFGAPSRSLTVEQMHRLADTAVVS